MPRKSNQSNQVIINTQNNPINPVDPVDDTNIQADKVKVQQVQQVQTQNVQEVEVEKKPKRKATPKQLESLSKGREISLANKKERDRLINEDKAEMKRRLNEIEQKLAEQKNLEFENKLIKTAVKVKTKQLNREKVLDSIVDDEETKEVVQKEVQKRQIEKKLQQVPTPTPIQQQQQPPKIPKFIFV